MMGKSKKLESRLFYHSISLEERISGDHPLRKIKQVVDFSFIRSEVVGFYGESGNTSIDPAVILKLMFLLFYENVSSERELVKHLPSRLDWLWFCDYDLDDDIPNHSVLSKARRRWGLEAFTEFFGNILRQCIDAGLVDGSVVHIDSSMINANASKDKLRPVLQTVSKKLYHKLEKDSDKKPRQYTPVDPDARLGKKYSQTTLGYKDTRAIDDKHGIVTATVITPANVSDNKVLKETIQTHEANTESKAKIAVADKKYGTIDNYKHLKDNDIKACISHQKYGFVKAGMFGHDEFKYSRAKDCFICPAGKKLLFYGLQHSRNGALHKRYRAKRETCAKCGFFDRCVSSATCGRQVIRNVNAEYVEWADNCLTGRKRKYYSRRRWHKAEGSFADATNNHGYKRARWRTIVKVQIQNLLIAATQNLRKLIKAVCTPTRTSGSQTKKAASSAVPAMAVLKSAKNCFYNALQKLCRKNDTFAGKNSYLVLLFRQP